MSAERDWSERKSSVGSANAAEAEGSGRAAESASFVVALSTLQHGQAPQQHGEGEGDEERVVALEAEVACERCGQGQARARVGAVGVAGRMQHAICAG